MFTRIVYISSSFEKLIDSRELRSRIIVRRSTRKGGVVEDVRAPSAGIHFLM